MNKFKDDDLGLIDKRNNKLKSLILYVFYKFL